MFDISVEARRSRRNASEVVRRLLLLFAVLYFLPLLGLGVFQRWLVFGASATHSNGTTEAPPHARLIWLRTQDGSRFEAYYGHALLPSGVPDPRSSRRPTLLFFTGKGASLAGARGLFQSLQRLDTNVLMPKYPGYGRSGGQEAETNCFAAARASYQC